MMNKKLYFTIATLLSIQFIAQATLVNGFSNIQASNPRNSDQRIQASDKRIAEQMGKTVTVQSFTNFLNLTKNFISNLSNNPSQTDLQTVIKAIIDLFRAFNQLDSNDQSDDLQKSINSIKKQALQLPLSSQLKKMLNYMTQ